MSFLSKPSKTLKKWGSGSAYGWKKRSPLNYLTHPIFTAKKLYNGIRRKTWKSNVSKLFGMSRHANVNSASSYLGSVYGPTGSIVGRY